MSFDEQLMVLVSAKMLNQPTMHLSPNSLAYQAFDRPRSLFVSWSIEPTCEIIERWILYPKIKTLVEVFEAGHRRRKWVAFVDHWAFERFSQREAQLIIYFLGVCQCHKLRKALRKSVSMNTASP